MSFPLAWAKVFRASHPFRFDRYDTFWSCCASKQHIGFNGVATFARTGLTLSADPRPLSKYLDAELNSEGRAILTRHPGFSILNVYTPNAGSGRQRLPAQLAFLEACKLCLRNERNMRGLPVVMGGDFNLTYRGIDRHWKWRLVSIAALFRVDSEAQQQGTQGIVGEMLARLQAQWGVILAMLESAKLETFESTSARGKKSTKYRVRASGFKGKVVLGSPSESDSDWSTKCYLQFNKGSSSDEQDPLWFTIGALAECFEKAVGRPWGNASQLVTFADGAGQPTTPTQCQEWMKSMLAPEASGVPGQVAAAEGNDSSLEVEKTENMVDTFALVRPQARDRFTCWEQYRNRRYINEGSRIDYFLVDATLAGLVLPGGPLSCGKGIRGGGGRGSLELGS